MKKPHPASPGKGARLPAKGRRADAAARSRAVPTPKTPSKRASRAAARRQAIMAAGLEEFIARGFSAARLEDVAKRAGVAKGTIYLHFEDKEALFQELIRSAVVPLIERLAAPPVAGVSARARVRSFAESFAREVVPTQRGDLVRLFVMEGARFP